MKKYVAVVAVIILLVVFAVVHRQAKTASTPLPPMTEDVSEPVPPSASADIVSDPTLALPPAAQPSPNIAPQTANQAQTDTLVVIVNGHTLSAAEIQALKARYGSVAPGEFWYDSRSGLYGRIGEPPIGLLDAGWNFGPLSPDASRGDTSVYINGREITSAEVALLTSYVGQVPPGSYWLNANGDYGTTASGVALGNLYATKGSAGSGSGDNFWSSNFSAGNSNADNTQGYVSVPGVGPVGYGF